MDLASRIQRASASIHNAQLIGVELLKGKVAPGLIQLGLFLRKMQGTQSPAGRPSGKLTLRRRCRKQILSKLTREVLQRTPNRGAHRFLRHASSQSINRGDSAGMDAGGFFVALLENFILGMVNGESALEIFDAPINKELHALNNGAIHERHVPPAQGQEITQNGPSDRLNLRLKRPSAAPAEVSGRGFGNHNMMAYRNRSRHKAQAILPPPILMPEGIPRQNFMDHGQAFFLQLLHEAAFKAGYLVEKGVGRGGHHGM